ncbi:GPP34 family phosphoprotein [Actinoplanes sp. NPDC023714]|uniref:GOLPH3/VPS74 family protein n=1 Tax=Actinoplanes sp. NPDC023714 TaxID=3154322 RepID=UPI0033CFE5D5
MTSPQQLPPADDFYLAAHDGIGGRTLIADRVLGVGLAAGLLGELMFWRRIQSVSETAFQVVDPQPTGDQAASAVLGRLAGTAGPHDLRQWIPHLAAGPATELIEHRLLAAGVLRRETKRRLLGTNTSLVFDDPRSTGQPAVRIRTRLSYNQPLDTVDLMLAGLFLATGLDEMVFDTLNPRDRARLSDQFRRNLPQPLHHLVGCARAAAMPAAVGS